MADPNRHRDSLRPELREAIDESWKLSDIENDVTPCRDKDTKPVGKRGNE